MELESSFTVPAPPEQAYRFLLDLERVAPCIPGGTLGEPDASGVYPATVTVKLGPMRIAYEGTLQVASADAAARTATVSARARETRGNGTVQSTMAMRVLPAGVGSAVAVTTTLELTGRAAQMGRGIVEDVAAKLVAEMSECLAARISADGNVQVSAQEPAPAPAVSGLALLGHVVRTRLSGLLHRGGGA
jgi:carbon monoxide dehydrogenase subunit G